MSSACSKRRRAKPITDACAAFTRTKDTLHYLLRAGLSHTCGKTLSTALMREHCGRCWSGPSAPRAHEAMHGIQLGVSLVLQVAPSFCCFNPSGFSTGGAIWCDRLSPPTALPPDLVFGSVPQLIGIWFSVLCHKPLHFWGGLVLGFWILRCLVTFPISLYPPLPGAPHLRVNLTYLPHKAVAEVSKDKEPIGRERAEFNWFESHLMSDSNELRVKWFGCHLIWDSNDFGCQLIWDSIDLVVNWFEIPMTWLSVDVCFKWFWLSVDLNFKWCGCQLIWDSSDSVVTLDFRFKWFGCQSIWNSNDLVVNRCVLQMILVVCWVELQVMWLSTDLRFKWFGCHTWFEIQMSWLSIDLRFKWFGCQMIWGSSDLVVNWCDSNDFVKRSISARLPSKLKLWTSKTKLFCETSFKIEALKLKNEAFVRDFLQKWSFELWRSKTKQFCETSFKIEALKLKNEAFVRDFLQKWSFELWRSKTKQFCETSFKIAAFKLQNEAFVRDFLQKWIFEDQKRSNSARLPSKTTLWSSKTRLPSKTTLWSSKTKLLCETSFKNDALKLKNEAFVRDFLQKWIFEDQKRNIFARLPSKMTSWPDAWPQNSNTFLRFLSERFKSIAPATKKLSRGIRSPVTATRNDHRKVTLPWHEICNHSTDSASEASNIDIARREITAPATRNASFRSLFKSTTPANVFATLTNSCACHVFCNVSKSLRLPREKHFEPPKTPRDRQFLTILTSKSLSRAGVVQILRSSTSKSVLGLPVFNDFDFRIALARRRGANFARLNFQKCSGPASF